MSATLDHEHALAELRAAMWACLESGLDRHDIPRWMPLLARVSTAREALEWSDTQPEPVEALAREFREEAARRGLDHHLRSPMIPWGFILHIDALAAHLRDRRDRHRS